jgi:ApaG protein
MTSTLGSSVVTQGIRVSVEPWYDDERSAPSLGQFVFGYQVTIANEGKRRVQLLSRKWTIIDGAGNREEVEGAGVVGESPVLFPGQSFSYESSCPLPMYWGTMEGEYTFLDDRGKLFPVQIGRFHLVASSLVV